MHLAIFSEVIPQLSLKHQKKPPVGLDQAVSSIATLQHRMRVFPWVNVVSAVVAFLLPLDKHVSAGHFLSMSKMIT